ncbi:phage tail protein I [Novosphingobium mangrovi (ex Hu et al. 2023)]|uniref:Phage tail protein I n=1 Tax=Novosphingobium mangrovi (ex Hu et al. 2023) TaxID=2930094 RepID=A0ABT0A8V9_9SPHN|nr:phage tail protein I [Novosphingobium mangrovi (ex Hu et al. 2023)]MCJ1959641.1 phage tail protein I [Novosphingobium mangrovi (ex Hu et al. 2023)]
MSLLPPNATAAERALEEAMLSGIDLSAVGTLHDPWTCPAEVLPFLAWFVAISHWDTTWSEAQKRAAVAAAIPFHKIKGTRAAVEQVLARFDEKLSVREWWEIDPPRPAHTFEVRADALEIPASFLTQEVAEAIIADVAAAKPLRAHFDFVQNLDLASGLHVAGGARGGAVARADYAAALNESRDWLSLLQTEDGEPIFDGDSADFLETR